jgi:ADP-ribose pyrophosphatase
LTTLDEETGMDDSLKGYFELMRREPARFAEGGDLGIVILKDLSKIAEVERAKARQLESKSLPSEWSRVGLVFEDEYLRVLRDAVQFCDGAQGTYVRILTRREGVSGVAVFAVHQGKAIMMRQFRHAPREWMLEIPRGFVDENESPEQAAHRELMEETGAAASRIESLGAMHPNSGLLSERVELFYCECESVMLMATNEGEAELVDLAALAGMVTRGEITDSFTNVALVRAIGRKLIANPF